MGLWLPSSKFEHSELLHPGRKPSCNVKIDRTNSITDGMILCLPFQYQNTNLARTPELCRGYDFELNTAATTAGPDGVACDQDYAGIIRSMPNADHNNMFTNDFTMSFLWRSTGDLIKGYRYFMMHTAYNTLSLYFTSTAHNIYLCGTRIIENAYEMLDGKLHLITLSKSGDLLTMYLGGEKITSTTKALSVPTGVFSIGGRTASLEKFSGGVFHAFNMFNYAVTDTDIKNFSYKLKNDPYGFLIPS